MSAMHCSKRMEYWYLGRAPAKQNDIFFSGYTMKNVFLIICNRITERVVRCIDYFETNTET